MAANQRIVKLKVINDLICANCAISHHELLTALKHCKEDLKLPLQFDIEFLPFRLIPTTTIAQDYEPKIEKAQFYAKSFGEEKFQKLQESVAKWGEEKGVPMSFRGVFSQSTRAHRLSRKAYHLGGMKLQIPCLMTLFRVHLQECKDLADVNVLADVAAEIGMMSKEEAVAFLNSDELVDEVEAMCETAKAKGVTGVPFTVIDDKWAISGGQASDVYVQIFKKLAGTCPGNNIPSSFGSPLTPTQTLVA